MRGIHAIVFICDVGALAEPDLGTIGDLARLELLARRLGGRVHLRNVPLRLRELIVLCGLGSALGLDDGDDSRIEVRREAEQRKQPLGVQEEADPGDLPARDLDDL